MSAETRMTRFSGGSTRRTSCRSLVLIQKRMWGEALHTSRTLSSIPMSCTSPLSNQRKNGMRRHLDQMSTIMAATQLPLRWSR